MNLDSIVPPFARIHFAFSKRRERQMGYKLVLHGLSPHWINATMIFDMAPVWKRFGLSAIGVNYFTIGAVKNGISSRYDATSPYYQSWLGGYIVQFPTPREWTLNDHFELGVADQKNWLKLYSVRDPFVEVQKSSVKNRGNIMVSGRKGKLYEGNIWSNTDVGNTKPFALPYMTAGMANLFHFDNSKAKINGSELTPRWKEDEPLAPFAKILLKGYIALIPLDSTTTVMLYANGCAFTDKRGKKVDTFETIATELQKLMKKTEIQSIS